MEDSNPALDPLSKNSDIKKPVPLPRKIKPCPSAHEPTYGNAPTASMNNVEKVASGTRMPLRRLSKSFQEKIKAHGIDKSFRRIMPKRRSIGDSGSSNEAVTNSLCSSMPENNFFSSISFNSPLVSKSGIHHPANDSDSSEADSFHTSSELPPSYPPPPLPDESTYDELTSVSSEGRNSYYSPGSDSNSIYEELTNYLSKGMDDDKSLQYAQSCRSTSWNYSDAKSESRYEEITEESDATIPIDFASAVCVSNAGNCETAVKKSLVQEFDPLADLKEENISSSKNSISSNPFADPQILAFLRDDGDAVYGNISKKHESILSDFENMNFEMPQASGPPPVPPRRIDSVPELEPPVVPELRSNSEEHERRYNRIRSSIEFRVKQVARYVSNNIESGPLGRKHEKRGLLDKMHSEDNAINEESEKRPVSCEDNYVPLVLYHSGTLLRSGGIKRWGVLAQRKLTLFASKDSPDIKETILVDTILSLRICSNEKISVDGEQVLCFEVSLSGKSNPLVLGALSSSERHMWMRKLLESVTPAFPPKLALDYDKAGWCYLKEGISSKWSLSSILLSQRSLHLVPSNRADALVTADLRMARSIYETANDAGLTCKKTSEKGPVLVVDMQEYTLYMQMDTSGETAAWQAVIRSAALNNGPALNQQQLTKDQVPAIVDKTINFVHTHGSVSEGIYRRSGSNSAVSKLLTLLRKDAWAVQLSRADFTEYDVASAMKRFFRDLPEPLFIPELHTQFRAVVENSSLNLSEKLEEHKLVLGKLPQVNYRTLRRLIGHLYFIDKLNAKNLMPVDNLAAIWGPTLMHVQEGASLDPNWSRVESIGVAELISHYPTLFSVAEEELRRELNILELLASFQTNSGAGATAVKKPSGDLKVWVYLRSHTDGDCVSVAVPPGKVAREMCEELSERMSEPGHALTLWEVVSGGSLRRPLHHADAVLDAVLRWGAWPEQDRRDNCLVLGPSAPLQDLIPLTTTPLLPAVDELKFADARTKNFKNYLFELSQTVLTCYKDRTCSVKVREWELKDLVWYMGHEPKRNPHAGWAVTFLTNDSPPTRSKDRPFFGNTLCGTTEQQRRKWTAALLLAQHPAGILPPPVLIE